MIHENLVVTVNVSRDWVDWLLFGIQVISLLGTSAAAILAFLTIREAKRQAKDATDTLVRERRLDFELDILRDLVLAVERVDAAAVRGLALMLPATDIPLTRAAARLPANDQAEARLKALGLPAAAHPTSGIDGLKIEIADELVEAIATRVEERQARG